jgi:hypothetical protein
MKKVIFLSFLLLVMVQFGFSQEAALVVDEMVVCTSVEDRQPVGADSSFLDNVETLYCFTRITGAEEPTTVSHVWYYNDKEMANVELNVGEKSWRTWSSKRIVEEWVGNWRVDVVAAGEVLKSLEFTVKAP